MGFPDGHVGTAVPATLVILNTFASYILFGGTIEEPLSLKSKFTGICHILLKIVVVGFSRVSTAALLASGA